MTAGNTVKKLAYIFHGFYERTGDTDAEIEERGKEGGNLITIDN